MFFHVLLPTLLLRLFPWTVLIWGLLMMEKGCHGLFVGEEIPIAFDTLLGDLYPRSESNSAKGAELDEIWENFKIWTTGKSTRMPYVKLEFSVSDATGTPRRYPGQDAKCTSYTEDKSLEERIIIFKIPKVEPGIAKLTLKIIDSRAICKETGHPLTSSNSCQCENPSMNHDFDMYTAHKIVVFSGPLTMGLLYQNVISNHTGTFIPHSELNAVEMIKYQPQPGKPFMHFAYKQEFLDDVKTYDFFLVPKSIKNLRNFYDGKKAHENVVNQVREKQKEYDRRSYYHFGEEQGTKALREEMNKERNIFTLKDLLRYQVAIQLPNSPNVAQTQTIPQIAKINFVKPGDWCKGLVMNTLYYFTLIKKSKSSEDEPSFIMAYSLPFFPEGSYENFGMSTLLPGDEIMGSLEFLKKFYDFRMLLMNNYLNAVVPISPTLVSSHYCASKRQIYISFLLGEEFTGSGVDINSHIAGIAYWDFKTNRRIFMPFNIIRYRYDRKSDNYLCFAARRLLLEDSMSERPESPFEFELVYMHKEIISRVEVLSVGESPGMPCTAICTLSPPKEFEFHNSMQVYFSEYLKKPLGIHEKSNQRRDLQINAIYKAITLGENFDPKLCIVKIQVPNPQIGVELTSFPLNFGKPVIARLKFWNSSIKAMEIKEIRVYLKSYYKVVLGPLLTSSKPCLYSSKVFKTVKGPFELEHHNLFLLLQVDARETDNISYNIEYEWEFEVVLKTGKKLYANSGFFSIYMSERLAFERYPLPIKDNNGPALEIAAEKSSSKEFRDFRAEMMVQKIEKKYWGAGRMLDLEPYQVHDFHWDEY